MVYDYGGFPPHTYRIVYPAPGAPELAARVAGLIEAGGCRQRSMPSAATTTAPSAPPTRCTRRRTCRCCSSAAHGLDPAEHLALGRLLAPLRDEGVLIIGSGFSFHNLRLLGEAGGVALRPRLTPGCSRPCPTRPGGPSG